MKQTEQKRGECLIALESGTQVAHYSAVVHLSCEGGAASVATLVVGSSNRPEEKRGVITYCEVHLGAMQIIMYCEVELF